MSSSSKNGASGFFADTSALLYLVADHPGEPFAWVKEILESAPLAACDLFYPEAIAALRARKDQQRLTQKGFLQALRGLEDLWSSLYLVESVPALMRAAGLLAQRHPLKGADAVHLAAALAFARRGPFPIRFFTLDRARYRVAKGFLEVYPIPEFEENP